MRLNHPGIYRIIGENFELLANIIGEVPCMRITSALLVNDLVQKGEFTILPEESIEIQSVLANPDKFVFLEYEYSEICSLPSYRQSIHGTKMPNITDEQLKTFTNKYLEDIGIYGRGVAATKAYILETTGWSLAQINVVLMKIAKRVKQQYVNLQFDKPYIYHLGS